MATDLKPLPGVQGRGNPSMTGTILARKKVQLCLQEFFQYLTMAVNAHFLAAGESHHHRPTSWISARASHRIRTHLSSEE